MATIKPFCAIRPSQEYASMVAALPYDVMDSIEAREAVKDNPYSFLHIDKAEIDLEPSVDPYDKSVYLKARENLNKLINENIMQQDTNECFYIYRQIFNGRSQTGLVSCASIDEYIDNTIKKHELTRADKEADRTNHVDVCDANTGPIFLTYQGKDEIDRVIDCYKKTEPVYDFVCPQGVKQTVWIIDKRKDIDLLVNAFLNVKSLYIADGHHRCASAVNVGQKRRKQFPNYTGEEKFNFFLAVLFKSDELSIMDYNRLIKDYNGYNKFEIIDKIKNNFDIEKKQDKEPYRPIKKHTFGMYIDGEWYALSSKQGSFDPDNPVERLDVSILQNNLIAPVFNITDPRTDKRIDFTGGIRGLKELEKRVNQDMAVAFSMYPTTIDDLIAIADANKIMPPKSTWFEPKLLSGLFIYKLS